ncbi:hypothetical protein H0H93_003300 [Arthromyces matolae]|nr:hypothetical protein H0H93_003300 [Arthromyces matolae]
MQSSVEEEVDEYAADFTSINKSKPVRCEREVCATKTFPAGTKLHFLHSNDVTVPGKNVCADCYLYYLNKKTTKRKGSTIKANGEASTGAMSAAVGIVSPKDRQVIHKGIAAAQRGQATNHVQPLGSTYGLQHPAVIHTSNGPVQVPARNRSQASDGPLIQIPGYQPWAIPAPLAASSNIVPGRLLGRPASGYTAEHAEYFSTRQILARKAYADEGGRVVVCQVRAVHMPVGKTKEKLIGDVLETVENIPVHIGAVALKQILYDRFLPVWLTYSCGFAIKIDQIIMRRSNWAVIEPKSPDCDAIAQSFFPKNRKGEPTFKTGTCIINFHLPNRLYDQYLDFVEEQEEQKLALQESLARNNGKVTRSMYKGKQIEVSNVSTRKIPKAQGTKRLRSPSPDVDDDIENMPVTPPQPKRRAIIYSGPSPTSQQLEQALRSQRPPSAKEVQKLFNANFIKPIRVSTYLVQQCSLLDVIKLHSDDKWCLASAQPGALCLDFSPQNQKKGGFKLATFGTTSPNIFGESNKVVAKQTFYSKSKDGKAKIIPHDGRKQAQNLTTEILCLVWARVLLELVYRFIEKEREARGIPPFSIPQMRFVQAALAIEDVEENQEARAFLLEEVIEESEGSKFRKYMNNVSPVPLPLLSSGDIERGQFLAFSQHVQYFKTRKMAFVSDYQGGDFLLTDPQVVTAERLGDIFAEGNLPEAHENFEKHHRCNKFCKYFELPTDYDIWESQSTSSLKPLESRGNEKSQSSEII